MNRRSLITGFASLIAAPAIVRASSLMPVVPLRPRVLTFRGIPFLVHPADGLVLHGHDGAEHSDFGVTLEFALQRTTPGGAADIRILGVSLNRRKTDCG